MGRMKMTTTPIHVVKTRARKAYNPRNGEVRTIEITPEIREKYERKGEENNG